MSITDACNALTLSAERFDHCARLVTTLKGQGGFHAKLEHYNAEAPVLGLSQEDLTMANPVALGTMSMEAAKATASAGVGIIEKATALYHRFAPLVKENKQTIVMAWDYIQKLKADAAARVTAGHIATTAQAAEHAAHGTDTLIAQGAKGLANAKQIKMILIAMTATMAFVGFAMTTLVSTIRQQSGLPSLSEKLSQKLRTIHWPFGDFGLSKGGDHTIGGLTLNGTDATTIDTDSKDKLLTHMAPDMNLMDLSGTMPSDPLPDQKLDASGAGIIQAIKTHPILSVMSAVAMVVGVYLLCTKIVKYVIQGGWALIKRSVAPLEASLKVRPLK